MMEAKTSEGKAQMWVMSILPFLFGGALQVADPDWMKPLFTDPIGWVVLMIAGAMWLVGVFLTRRVTQMEV
jgi:tight adherence protein B